MSFVHSVLPAPDSPLSTTVRVRRSCRYSFILWFHLPDKHRDVELAVDHIRIRGLGDSVDVWRKDTKTLSNILLHPGLGVNWQEFVRVHRDQNSTSVSLLVEEKKSR